MTRTEHRFLASRSAGEVSAILDRPEHARWLYVFGHGAGAGMRHGFMERASEALGAERIATFRYQFPYVEKRLRRPDPLPILLSTVRAAVAEAHSAAGDLPLLAGGKSMGGRMTSSAIAGEPLPGVQGLVFFGFPLHPIGKPGSERSEHLDRVPLPMLFLQGTRDKLAEVDLLRPVIERLGARATLHLIEEADHSFALPKRTGRDLDDVLFELARATATWADRLDAQGPGEVR